jgi:hypothetical protein
LNEKGLLERVDLGEVGTLLVISSRAPPALLRSSTPSPSNLAGPT